MYEVIGFRQLNAKGGKAGNFLVFLRQDGDGKNGLVGDACESVFLSADAFNAAEIAVGVVVGRPAYGKDSTFCIGFLPA